MAACGSWFQRSSPSPFFTVRTSGLGLGLRCSLAKLTHKPGDQLFVHDANIPSVGLSVNGTSASGRKLFFGKCEDSPQHFLAPSLHRLIFDPRTFCSFFVLPFPWST